jgi:hypothetical protein
MEMIMNYSVERKERARCRREIGKILAERKRSLEELVAGSTLLKLAME